MLYFAQYIVTWVDEDARSARCSQQLDDEAEGRGGRGGKALAELEDIAARDIDRQHGRARTRALEQLKAEREEQRTDRTTELVERSRAAEAAMPQLGSKAAAATRSSSATRSSCSAGDKADKAAADRLKKSASAEIERVNTGIQEQEAAEEASVAPADRRPEAPDATPQLEAERERLRTRPRASRRRSASAKDEITKLAARDDAPRSHRPRRLDFRELDRKYGAGIRGGPACSGPAWAPRPSAS